MRSRSAPSDRHAPDTREGFSAYLYDAEGRDRPVQLDHDLLKGLSHDDLLWIDARMDDGEALEFLNDLLGTEMRPLNAGGAPARPAIEDYGKYFVLRVLPPAKPRETRTLLCAVGQSWLATIHQGDVSSLEGFADHLRGDTALGKLDAPAFLAFLLEWVINGYFDELDRLQAAIDATEERILRERGRRAEVEELVALRHAVARLRRRLAPHRQVLTTLAHPSFDVVSDVSAAPEFGILAERLQMAIEAADATREMIIGALDVFMAQAAQRTNDTMKLLATVSLLLLPASLIAGTLGMNMLPEYLLQSWIFWAALVGMVAVSAGLLAVMRLRRWM